MTSRTEARWADPLLVATLAVAAFLPGLFGDFLNWDDDRVFLDQVRWRGLGPAQLSWMFTTFHMGHYRPLTWITHGLDYALWGLRPSGYHLTSILIHAGSAVVFLFVARRLLRAALGSRRSEAALRLGSVSAALLFAVHPLRVEPVTWLSTRGDVLSGLLALCSVLAYLRAQDRQGRPRSSAWHVASLALFALALAAKAVVLMLPLVLLVLDVYPLGRLRPDPRTWLDPGARRVWLEKLPFAALAGVAAAVAYRARLDFGSVLAFQDFTATARATALVHGLSLYLSKTVWPAGLSPLYDYWSALGAGPWPRLTRAGLVAAVTLLAVIKRRTWPGLAAAWAVSVLMVLPVSGIVQNGPQIAADRYSYLAMLGWAVLAGAGLAWCADRWWQGGSYAVAGAAAHAGSAALLVALVSLTAWQTLIWQDSVALWSHAVRLDPRSPIAHANLASALWPSDLGQARAHYARAVALAPGLPAARQGLAFTLSLEGDSAGALAQAREAVRAHPWVGQSWLFLGETLRVDGQLEEAAGAFAQAVRLERAAPQPRFRLATTLAALGRREEAVTVLERGQALARAAGVPEADGYRAAALVFEHWDPARARAAWQRYLASAAAVPQLRPAERQNMLNALAALDRLNATRPAASGTAAGAPRTETR